MKKRKTKTSVHKNFSTWSHIVGVDELTINVPEFVPKANDNDESQSKWNVADGQ